MDKEFHFNIGDKIRKKTWNCSEYYIPRHINQGRLACGDLYTNGQFFHGIYIDLLCSPGQWEHYKDLEKEEV